MTSELKTFARMLAHRQKRAVLAASHQRVVIKEDALILSFVAMAGEPTTMHCVALGPYNQPPEIRCVPDPRHRVYQNRMYGWLCTRLQAYFDACYKRGSFPQVWVSGGAGVQHLGTIADSIRWRHDAPDVQRLADLLSYLVYRHDVAGQQALMPASLVLSNHFASPQSASDDDHLGSMLCWLNPPQHVAIEHAVTQAEALPDGVKTTIGFDQNVLEPLVTAFNNARRAKSQALGKRYAEYISMALRPVVEHIHGLTQRAISCLHEAQLPELADLEGMVQCESQEFQFFYRGFQQDTSFRPQPTDSTTQATYKLTKHELAQNSYDASLVQCDRFAYEQARFDGDVLVGTVRSSDAVVVDGKRQHHIELYTDQTILSVRLDDELHRLDDHRFVVRVIAMSTCEDGGTRIVCQILKGQRCCGVPQPEASLSLYRRKANWDFRREMGRIHKRLKQPHWLLDQHHIPNSPETEPCPSHLLELVEALS